jgi:hypothetical protein
MVTLLATLDTCVLADLDSGTDEVVLANLDLIAELRRHLKFSRVQLVLDFERHVVAEYETVLQQDSLGRRFHTTCISLNYYTYASSRPTNACGTCLEALGFDPSDRKFVGLLQPGGFYVTTEQKHLAQPVRDRVSQCCSVQIMTLEELCRLLR